MIVSMHQPAYFPWIGLMDKVAKSDFFIILDEVQLNYSSEQRRNEFLTKTGQRKFLSISISNHGRLERKINDMELKDSKICQRNHKNFVMENYKHMPYFAEVFPRIEHIFENDYICLVEIVRDSFFAIKDMFGIEVPVLTQSQLQYDREQKKSDLVLEICKTIGAEIYLSGQGGKRYMDDGDFNAAGIAVLYQKFDYPRYSQIQSKEFEPNLSALDCLFNIGIEKTRELFYSNLKSER